jgi:hypothetical protein
MCPRSGTGERGVWRKIQCITSALEDAHGTQLLFVKCAKFVEHCERSCRVDLFARHSNRSISGRSFFHVQHAVFDGICKELFDLDDEEEKRREHLLFISLPIHGSSLQFSPR